MLERNVAFPSKCLQGWAGLWAQRTNRMHHLSQPFGSTEHFSVSRDLCAYVQHFSVFKDLLWSLNSLLSSVEGPKKKRKKGLWEPAYFKNGSAQKWLLRQFSLCSSLILHPRITYIMRVEKASFLNLGFFFFFVNRRFLPLREVGRGRFAWQKHLLEDRLPCDNS